MLGVGLDRLDEIYDSLLLWGPAEFPEELEVAVEVHACQVGLHLPGVKKGESLVGAEVVGALSGMGLVVGEDMGCEGKCDPAGCGPAEHGGKLAQVFAHDDEL